MRSEIQQALLKHMQYISIEDMGCSRCAHCRRDDNPHVSIKLACTFNNITSIGVDELHTCKFWKKGSPKTGSNAST